MFLGPLTANKPWSTHGISGVHRFLSRAHRLFLQPEQPEQTQQPQQQQQTASTSASASASAADLAALENAVARVTAELLEAHRCAFLKQSLLFILQ